MGIRKTTALAVLALALSTGCVSTEARKVKMPWYSGFIGGGGGTPFNGTLAAGVPLTLTGATSGTTGLSAAAVTTGSVTYSLPSGDGNAFSVLTTNGSHVLNWQTFQAGTGITLTRSGNTTTIASTGGGGGGGGSLTGITNPSSGVLAGTADLGLESAIGSTITLGATGNGTNGQLIYDNNNSYLGPFADGDLDLGTTTNAWAELYVHEIRGPAGGQVTIFTDGYFNANATFAGDVRFAGTNSTGAVTNTLGTNGPNVTTTPYTWIKVITADSSVAYVPCWK